MTEDHAERRIRFGGRLATVLAALGGLVLGIATGFPLPAFLAVVGGMVLAGSGRALSRPDNETRAVGSVGLAVGGLALLAAIALGGAQSTAGAGLATATGVGVLAVALDALVESPVDASPPVGRAVKRSVALLLVVAFVGALWHLGVLPALGLVPVVAVSVAVTPSAFVALVSLQVLALVTLALVRAALPVLAEWLSGVEDDPLARFDRVGLDPRAVPGWYWALLGVQAVVAVLDPAGTLFAWTLAALSVLGTAVELALVSGILHLPLALVALLSGTVLAARGLQRFAVWWAGPHPATALAFGSGGAVVGTVVTALAAVPPVGDALGGWLSAVVVDGLPGVIGATATTLVGVAFVLGIVRGLVLVFPAVTAVGAVPASAGGYAVGGTALFVAALAAAEAGAPAPVVFAGAAGSLLVWDLGENATGLREQLGREVDTRRVEVTHATGSALVGGAAVVVATVAGYLLGPIGFAPVDRTRAMVALVLALLALIAFVYTVENPIGRESESDRATPESTDD